MFRSAFDDGYYVYSYIPAREKENKYLFTVKAFCRLISNRCEITVTNQSILFFVDWLATIMLYNGRQSIYFIFCRLISDRYGP